MTDWLHSLIVQVEQMGGPGVVLFVLVYIAAAVTMAPAFPLTVAAGAIYGVARGSVVVFIGCVLGGSLAYLVAIKLTGTRLLSRYDRDPRVMVVRAAMREDSIWVQFLLRLSPIVPFTMLNYALGFARVRFRDFAVGFIGMIPAILMYTYYGKVVGDVTALAAGTMPPRGAGYYTFLIVGVATTVLASVLIGRAARRALKEGGGGTLDTRQ